jgi:hypothetical protein
MFLARLRLPAAMMLAGALIPGIALANYTAPSSMNSGEEVPTNGSTGRAIGTITIINKTASTPDSVRVNLTYSGLTSNVTAAHIHGNAVRGVNAGVLFTLTPTGGTSGSINNAFALTAQQKNDILGTLMYTNIHTVNNGGGEIRGQIDSLTAQGKLPATSTNGLILLTLALAATAVIVLSRRRLMA